MNRNVLVSISGMQTSAESDGAIEIISNGEYYFRNGKHYILYEEQVDEHSNCMDTKCTIKISENRMELIKKGDVTTRMFFEVGTPHISSYSTPFGDIVIGTTASVLRVNETEHELEAELSYSLDVNYEFVSECNLSIKVSDRPEEILP